MSSFRDLRIVDNFYQTSAFFPMPTVLIGTLTEDGKTSLGPYSLVQPYYVAGKDYYAMLLCARNNSNTAQHLLARGKCSINFITDEKKMVQRSRQVILARRYTRRKKMKNCQFTLEDGLMAEAHPEQVFPKVVTQSFQVFECTWMSDLENAFEDKPGQLDGYPPPYRNFNGITSQFGAHFILRVDKILMKEKQYQGIVNGVKAKDFPRVPVDYGYRDSKTLVYKISRPIPRNIAYAQRYASISALCRRPHRPGYRF